MGQRAIVNSAVLAGRLREEGYTAEYDLMNRSLKAQMKYANKIGAAFVLVLGDNEIESKTAKLKNMETGSETEIKLDDSFAENFGTVFMASIFEKDEANDIFSDLTK